MHDLVIRGGTVVDGTGAPPLEADVAIRDAIDGGLIRGPRVFAATRALVATGCYGPAGFDPRWNMPVGAQVADGVAGVRRAVREQIAGGADDGGGVVIELFRL